MNLILLFNEDFIHPQKVRLVDRRFTHISKVHRAKVGDNLSVGLLNDNMGTGTITEMNQNSVTMDVALHKTPPSSLPVTLVLALPRPNMLKRSLQTCATMGVKNLILLHSARVEKSYWQTPQLSNDNIRLNFLLGLEQAKDTVMPDITYEKDFSHFINNRARSLCKNSFSLVAHPKGQTICPRQIDKQTTLFIGPEGGFIDSEIDQLNRAGCQSVHLGQRILRVETAIPVLLSTLFY